MIRHYLFEYNNGEAEVRLKVDTKKFSQQDACSLLEFFVWDYDKYADPIDELMKKYAMKAIIVATAENYDLYDVLSWFAEQEGFIPLDGSLGVTLVSVEEYTFDEDNLEMTVNETT